MSAPVPSSCAGPSGPAQPSLVEWSAWKFGALVSSIFFGVGVLMLLFTLLLLVLPVWRARSQYVPHECRILDRRVAALVGSEGGYRPEFLIRYDVAGQSYECWTYDAPKLFSSNHHGMERVLAKWEIGSRRSCYYDPSHPERAVLIRDYDGTAILFTVVSGLLVVCGGIALAWSLLCGALERWPALEALGSAFRRINAAAPPWRPFRRGAAGHSARLLRRSNRPTNRRS